MVNVAQKGRAVLLDRVFQLCPELRLCLDLMRYIHTAVWQALSVKLRGRHRLAERERRYIEIEQLQRLYQGLLEASQ